MRCDHHPLDRKTSATRPCVSIHSSGKGWPGPMPDAACAICHSHPGSRGVQRPAEPPPAESTASLPRGLTSAAGLVRHPQSWSSMCPSGELRVHKHRLASTRTRSRNDGELAQRSTPAHLAPASTRPPVWSEKSYNEIGSTPTDGSRARTHPVLVPASGADLERQGCSGIGSNGCGSLAPGRLIRRIGAGNAQRVGC